MNENMKLAWWSVAGHVLAALAAGGLAEQAFHETDPHKKMMASDGARHFATISTVAGLSGMYNFYKGGYPKAAIGIPIAYLLVAALANNRKTMGYIRKDMAAARERPTPCRPRPSQRYPAESATDPFATYSMPNYGQW